MRLTSTRPKRRKRSLPLALWLGVALEEASGLFSEQVLLKHPSGSLRAGRLAADVGSLGVAGRSWLELVGIAPLRDFKKSDNGTVVRDNRGVSDPTGSLERSHRD